MACGLAVKRPLEFSENGSPAHDSEGPSSGKRARTSGLSSHCSPFRPAAFGVANFGASLPSTTSSSSPAPAPAPGASGFKPGAKQWIKDDNGPFAAAAASVRLSQEQLDSYLRAEIRYLRRRRLIPRRANQSPADETNGDGTMPRNGDSTLQTYRAPQSPTANNTEGHSSDSDNDASSSVPGPAPSDAKTSRELYLALADKKQFSLKQVQLICERLLLEQESRLRSEYESVLNNKLQEQYETFRKFTDDQIRRQFDTNAECPSCVSD